MSDTDLQSSAATAAEARPVSDIPGMLLPVSGKLLLLPGVSVAEIVNYSYPDRPDDAPAWYFGKIIWRKLEVPVVSFELLNGQELPRTAANRRIAVLNNTGVSDDLPFIAIIIQGIPRLVRVTPKDIGDGDNSNRGPAERMIVQLGSESVVIPDVGALERAYQQYAQGF